MSNLLTSRTDPVGTNVLTHVCPATKKGVRVLVKHTPGSGGSYVTLSVAYVPKADRGLSTDTYAPVFISATDQITVTAQTYKIVTGNLDFLLPVPDFVGSFTITPAWAGGTANATVVDCMDE